MKLGDELIVYFGDDKNERYGAAKTSDFITWTDIISSVSLPEGYHYGTIFKAQSAILEKLRNR